MNTCRFLHYWGTLKEKKTIYRKTRIETILEKYNLSFSPSFSPSLFPKTKHFQQRNRSAYWSTISITDPITATVSCLHYMCTNEKPVFKINFVMDTQSPKFTNHIFINITYWEFTLYKILMGLVNTKNIQRLKTWTDRMCTHFIY